MSVLVYNEVIYIGYVKRIYEITLTDNLGEDHVYLSSPVNVDPQDTGADAEAAQLKNVQEQEVRHWINEMEGGRDPAHVDMGGWFEHSVPLWDTWENTVLPSVQHWLKKSYMQDILFCKLTCDRLTNQELEAIAGKPNDVRAEQQIAVNTQATLDAYEPLVNEDGTPRE